MRVVLVCIAKNEENYIEEWVNYNKKLGFDEIYLYANDWKSTIESDFITEITFPGEHKQMLAYNHFLQNFRDEFDWAAFIDCDEFIVLKKHNNIKDFIKEFDNPFGIGVNWVFYGADNKVKREGNSLLKQFTKRQKSVDRHIKTLLNLKSGGFMQLPHNPNTPLMDTNRRVFLGPFNPNGDEEYIVLNHYHHKTYEDWLIRCERGQSDNTPTKEPKQWEEEKDVFCDIENLDAYNFMYKN